MANEYGRQQNSVFRSSCNVSESNKNSEILDSFDVHVTRGEFRSRQTRQLPRAVDLKGRLLSCQSY